MYREFLPTPALRRYLQCFWMSGPAGPATTGGKIVVPDACEDILVRARLRRSSHGLELVERKIELVGQMSGHIRPRSPEGTYVVGVRFHPGFLHGMTPLPSPELVDRSVPVEELDRHLAEDLAAATRPGSSLDAVFQRLERMLLRRFEGALHLPPVVEACLEELRARHGDLRLEELARRQGVSPRYLQRHFRQTVGVSPKRLARVLRFQKAYQALHEADAPATSTLATECGYADQAHLTREFRELAGRTPGALRRSLFFKSSVAAAA